MSAVCALQPVFTNCPSDVVIIQSDGVAPKESTSLVVGTSVMPAWHLVSPNTYILMLVCPQHGLWSP
jgi:hypothetical protein